MTLTSKTEVHFISGAGETSVQRFGTKRAIRAAESDQASTRNFFPVLTSTKGLWGYLEIDLKGEGKAC